MRNVTAAQKVQDTADATAAAVDSLTTTVTQQGNLLTSTGNRTTQLENGLATTNAAVAKKADATAVQDLTNTVKQLGNDLTAANSAITKLTGNLANTDKRWRRKPMRLRWPRSTRSDAAGQNAGEPEQFADEPVEQPLAGPRQISMPAGRYRVTWS
ncbi:hypothetical protein F3Y20_26755 [Klebsiella pneumoniae]|nr:hypothetical protein F3Y20_26755 [Klebsiella pneumoniae]